MFSLRLVKFSKAGTSAISLEFVLSNRASRSATILAYDFDLWLLSDINRRNAVFLGKLWPDLLIDFADCSKLDPQGEKPLTLVWHYQPRQLQQIEDWRKGSSPTFEVRGRVSAMSIWPHVQVEEHKQQFGWENVYGSAGVQNSYPFRFEFPQSDWATLLNEIGFRHLTLYEFPVPSFPPAFTRAEGRLNEAWEHFRAGRCDEAFLSCRQAFETLGHELYGDGNLSRTKVLERLMPSAPIQKRQATDEQWKALQNFLNMGVHERGESSNVNHADTEMVLVSATALLGYLARYRPG